MKIDSSVLNNIHVNRLTIKYNFTGKEVLDLGCGDGGMANAIAKKASPKK